MDRQVWTSLGVVGRNVPALSSALRPNALRELDAWGGDRLVRDKHVLDLGCGDGRFALGIAPLTSSVEGVDPDQSAIAAARRSARKAQIGNARFSVGAAQRLRYPDRTFDVVIMSWTL